MPAILATCEPLDLSELTIALEDELGLTDVATAEASSATFRDWVHRMARDENGR